jgi:CheY-like chemotaxis protein
MATISERLSPRPIEILMVDDDEGDVLLTKKALANGKIINTMRVARDGVEAIEFLKQHGQFSDMPRPDLVLLDLNMPRKDGREVLTEIKQDADLRSIPVVILTTSDSEHDICSMYDLQANCYISKPVDLDRFTAVIREIESFWFSVVKLPPL